MIEVRNEIAVWRHARNAYRILANLYRFAAFYGDLEENP